MSTRSVVIPDAVRRKAAAQGADGLSWMQNLGSLLADLEDQWAVSIGSPYGGGSMAYVAEARTADGRDAVVKLQMPGYDAPAADSFVDEVTALLVAKGRGYAQVLAHDMARRALLLERLGRPLSDLGLSIRAQTAVICATLKQAWVPVPTDAGLQTGSEKARWLTDFILTTWETLNHPCSERAIQQVLSFGEARRAEFDPGNAVLVHGDAHSGNTLQMQSSGSGGYKFVDPDGLLAERAYDLAIPMRDWSDELLAGDPVQLGRERCAYLNALTGVDMLAIWQWGCMERVSSGLLLLQLGYEAQGTAMLQVADAWAMP